MARLALVFSVVRPALTSRSPSSPRQGILGDGDVSLGVHGDGLFERGPLISSLVLPPSWKAAANAKQAKRVSELGCHEDVDAGDLKKGVKCPADCPYWSFVEFTRDAGPRGDVSGYCHFKCVAGDECGSRELGLYQYSIFPEEATLHCVECLLTGCQRCSKRDSGICAECAAGYLLDQNGQCREIKQLRMAFCTLVGFALLPLALWYADLRCRAVVNEPGLSRGLEFRRRRVLRGEGGPSEESDVLRGEGGTSESETAGPTWGSRQLLPLTTNLCREVVAGSGLLIHFNFQVMIIAWALIVAAAWCAFCLAVEPDLLWLGHGSFGTPVEICIATEHGAINKKNTMGEYNLFLYGLYVFSFWFFLAHAVLQYRCSNDASRNATMKDFCAICEGLPTMPGSARCEERLQAALEAALGGRIVGVSICWSFRAQRAQVEDAVDRSLDEREQKQGTAGAPDPPPRPPAQRCCHLVDDLVGGIFGFSASNPAAAGPNVDADVVRLLHAIPCTDQAHVVFEDAAARDAAVSAASASGGVEFEGNKLVLKKAIGQPGTVCWDHFDIGLPQFLRRLGLGLLCILAWGMFWTLGLYLPYANYMASHSSLISENPSLVGEYLLTVIICLGNQIMYFVCLSVAWKVGFRYKDQAEAAYMVLYFGSCFFQVCFDLAVYFHLCFLDLAQNDIRDVSGEPIGGMDSASEIFETWPMQKTLGHVIARYAFPACFFVPFVIEPVFAIFLVHHLKCLLVRSRSDVYGLAAERSLDFFQVMELGRYADIILNTTLAVILLIFPSGCFLFIMVTLSLSHVYIYALDHFRVLRATPARVFDGKVPGRCASMLLSLPTGLILAIYVYSRLCHEYDTYRIEYWEIWTVLGAFATHVLVHTLALEYLVPWAASKCFRQHSAPTMPYDELARRNPCSYFSANPVHCLRSQYIYRHEPPCLHYQSGKEHLLRANPKTHCHFEMAKT